MAPMACSLAWFLLSSLLQQVVAQCQRDVYTDLPLAPVFPTEQLDSTLTPSISSLITDHWSEVAKSYRPAAIVPEANPVQINCPHLTGTFVNFHDLGFAPGRDITLPENTRVLVHSCSTRSSDVFGVVSIPKTSELVFGDANITFQATSIRVFGKLLMGSPTCRLRNKITITLHGPRTLAGSAWTKGIHGVNSTVEIHGTQYAPTWTRLAKTIHPGDDIIFVQDMINWEVGQTIVVTTTELKDSRDYNRNEERVISAIYSTIHPTVAAIRVSKAFEYRHFAGRAYQAEVALLTRRIKFQGDALQSEPTDIANAVCSDFGDSTFPCVNKYQTGFGAHIRVEGPQSIGRFQGIEFFRTGQTNILGKYSLHFHMCLQAVPQGQLYAKDCSVHRSYFRAYAVHGTNNVVISQNVAYDVIGHAYFLEDGVEEFNTFEYNFGAHVHWLGSNTQKQSEDQWFGSQGLFFVEESPSLILPSDSAASVYYVTNAHNHFVGNTASGGWAGFSMPNLPRAVKLHENYKNGAFTPSSRNLLSFKGNVAHSTGYWFGSAGGVYVGGVLRHKNTPGRPLEYTAGREGSRYTCLHDPLDQSVGQGDGWCNPEFETFMLFEDTKVFLANRGLQHWGDRAEVIRTEIADVGISMNVFGTVFIDQLLVACRSLEHLPVTTCPSNSCRARDRQFWDSFAMLAWYDVGQNHILTNSEFRNCDSNWAHCQFDWDGKCNGASTFQMLTHSNQFVPEVMQATKNLTYTNCNLEAVVKFTVDQTATVQTVSGRLANWLDMDGTVFPGAFPKGTPLILGSKWANNWWKTAANCQGPRNDLWICPKGEDSVASLYLGYNDDLEALIGQQGHCPNGAGACAVVGAVTHFGRPLSEGLPLGENSKVTGPVIKHSGGWFVRFTNGTPRKLTIGKAQVYPSDVLLLAFPYPAGTAFVVRAIAPEWCRETWARCSDTLLRANSLQEVRSAQGDKYFYDSAAQLLYIRVVQRNEEVWDKDVPDVPHVPWHAGTVGNLASFTRNGVTLMQMAAWSGHIEIRASNCGTGTILNCAAVSPVTVPPALAPAPATSPVTWAPSTERTSTPTTLTPTASDCAQVWGQCAGGGPNPLEHWTKCCFPNTECVEGSDGWWGSCQECKTLNAQCSWMENNIRKTRCCQSGLRCTPVSATTSQCRLPPVPRPTKRPTLRRRRRG